MLGNPLTGNAKASARKTLQQIYPKAAGEQTDISFTPSFPEERFSKIEINIILKRLPKRKAPGFEGIDSFGFREGKSINHAVRKLLNVIEFVKKREHHVIVISLGIQGSFDNLKYDIIRKELRKLFTKSNISETLEDILSNLKVAIQTSDGPSVWKQTQGCPQGFCTSPLFCNIVADEILKTDWPKEIHLQGFVDDFAFVISGRTRRELEQHTSFAFETFKN
ncbi:hypothetical protein AVEN_50448-1 [Araneus ventricosus]|uniref:Reverse transcriptase domain-containing protein n=1 Tax=Araneus ventricosus TaxID=182803 RepID=A0A4Y2H2G4_ARAVE|nr:hypothetical protein AVEN_50448-1 [Araneus ventricosus]